MGQGGKREKTSGKQGRAREAERKGWLLITFFTYRKNEGKKPKKYIAATQRKKGAEKKKSGEAAPLMYSVNATNPPRGGFSDYLQYRILYSSNLFLLLSLSAEYISQNLAIFLLIMKSTSSK